MADQFPGSLSRACHLLAPNGSFRRRSESCRANGMGPNRRPCEEGRQARCRNSSERGALENYGEETVNNYWAKATKIAEEVLK